MYPKNSREALIAEALGEFHRLLTRIDAVQPRLDETVKRMEQTTAAMTAGVGPFRQEVGKFFHAHQQAAAKGASHATSQFASDLFAAQTRELKRSAQDIFNKEVTPPLRQLTAELQASIRAAHRPWDSWLTHAATAVTAAMLSAWLVMVSQPSGVSPALATTSDPQTPAQAAPSPVAAPPSVPVKARARREP